MNRKAKTEIPVKTFRARLETPRKVKAFMLRLLSALILTFVSLGLNTSLWTTRHAQGQAVISSGKELLTNGDFRQGTRGWTLEITRQAAARWELLQDGGPNGTIPALRVTVERVGAAVWGVMVTQGNLTLTEGRRYRLSFWARASLPSAQVSINLQQSQEPYRILTERTYNIILSDNWHPYTLDLRPMTSDSKVNLHFIVGFAEVSIWFASVSLEDEQPLGASAVGNWPDPSQLPIRESAPEALVFFDGRRVTSKDEWERQRKPEIRALMQHYMHGIMPPPSSAVGIVTDSQTTLEGDGIDKRVKISFGPPGTPPIDLHLLLPTRRREPVPVFVYPSFYPNWRQDDTHSLRQSLQRGYAVATFWYGDVFPEPTTGSWRSPDMFRGVFPYFVQPGQTKREPFDWGAIAMWAWGVQRVVDYLTTDRDIDSRRIAAIGHSRLGHVVLIAAAYDERIALVIPHQSMSQMRTPRGREVVRVKIVDQPHHLSDAFGRFLNQIDRLPFDMHSLVALVAPRPILITGGSADEWSDLPGMLETIRGADPVYRFLGAQGFGGQSMPAPGQLVGGPLAFYVGAGGHTMAYYWDVFWGFADKYLK